MSKDYSNPKGFEKAWRNALEFLRPPKDYTPAEWAENNIKIPLGNAIPGSLRFANAPYQVEPLNMMAEPTVERVTLMWGAQTGKELDVATLIPTPKGFKRMGDLVVGDYVIAPDGTPTKVTFVTEPINTNDQYQMTFTDGSTLLAGADHQWTVDRFSSKGKLESGLVKTTRQMLDNYKTVSAEGKKRYHYGIDNTAPIQGTQTELPVDPYTLGMWLGDGAKASGIIWINNDDAAHIVPRIPLSLLNTHTGSGCLGYSFKGLMPLLRQAGVLNDKHIPEMYLFADVDSRLALLQGLMDSDGSLSGACELSFSDERLASGARALIASLGFKVGFKRGKAFLNGVRHNDRFRMVFTAYSDGLVPFTLPRYVDLLKAKTVRADETLRRRITDITPLADKVYMCCITVDHPTSMYLAGDQFIPTHNTQLLNCAMGYYVAHNPVSQMMMQPSQGDLHTWLETKFNPMVESNEALNSVIAKPRSREGVNNQAMKSYPGGFLMFSWSGSPRTMRGRSAPIIYCDEVDGYEYTAEGHPVSLLWQRAATFGSQRKLLVTSTPTRKGSSFVESSYENGDRRRFHIPCPHCAAEIDLKWSNVIWDKNNQGENLPHTARYVCQECGCEINDTQKRAALRKGRWIAQGNFTGHASYHLSELYSAFRRWSDIVRSFLEKKATNDLQSFVNVSLAETWEEDGETIDEHGLAERREPMEKIPDDVATLFAGVDVQDNRLEMTLVGMGRGEELYIFKHITMYGDPSTPQLWTALDSQIFHQYETESGRQIAVRATAIDSGGHFTNSVYAYVKRNSGKRVFAIKGVGGEGKPISSRPSRNNVAKCPLFSVGVDTAKDLIFARLRVNEVGDGYIHFSDGLDDEYFRQLTAEKVVTRYHKGFKRRMYEKIRPRNEALDCLVYAYAAYAIIGLNVNALADRLQDDEPVVDKPKPAKQRPFVPRTSSNFINSWR